MQHVHAEGFYSYAKKTEIVFIFREMTSTRNLEVPMLSCGGLNRNSSPKIHVSNGWPIELALLGGVALLEEMCHWEGGL